MYTCVYIFYISTYTPREGEPRQPNKDYQGLLGAVGAHRGLLGGLGSPSLALKAYMKTSTPQLPFQTPQMPSNRDHKALNRGTLGGLGKYVHTHILRCGWSFKTLRKWSRCKPRRSFFQNPPGASPHATIMELGREPHTRCGSLARMPDCYDIWTQQFRKTVSRPPAGVVRPALGKQALKVQ